MFEEHRYQKEQPPSGCYWFEADFSKRSRGSKCDIVLNGGNSLFSGVGLRLLVEEEAFSIDEMFVRGTAGSKNSITCVPIPADLFIIDKLQEPDSIGRIVLPYIGLVTGVFGKGRPLSISVTVHRPGVFKGYFSGERVSAPGWST